MSFCVWFFITKWLSKRPILLWWDIMVHFLVVWSAFIKFQSIHLYTFARMHDTCLWCIVIHIHECICVHFTRVCICVSVSAHSHVYVLIYVCGLFHWRAGPHFKQIHDMIRIKDAFSSWCKIVHRADRLNVTLWWAWSMALALLTTGSRENLRSVVKSTTMWRSVWLWLFFCLHPLSKQREELLSWQYIEQWTWILSHNRLVSPLLLQ